MYRYTVLLRNQQSLVCIFRKFYNCALCTVCMRTLHIICVLFSAKAESRDASNNHRLQHAHNEISVEVYYSKCMDNKYYI